MSHKKNYLFLKTDRKLSEKEKNFLNYLLEEYFLQNLISPIVYYKNGKMKKIKSLIFKENDYYWYCYPVTRRINDEELNEIDNKLKFVFNFEYYLPQKYLKKKKNDDVIETISKLVYNKFLNDKIEKGWRFGLVYDKKNKISPKIISWDNLKNYQKNIFKKKICDIYEIMKFYF
ncbi:MAG: hypothetical protein QXG00_05765 [Candidatus Woesearchaeota archaeon]